MAGETINQAGAYAQAIAAASIVASGFSLESSDIATAIPAEKLYPLLDFELVWSAGVATAGTVFNIYKRNKGGTAAAAAPSATNKQQYVGSITLNAFGTGYLRGAVNSDQADSFYVENTDTTNAQTVQLKIRGRTYNAAP